ncbi:MAG: ChbG/HpnK family deacetylase [Neisseria sp.]|nr:ChbG/HpnK family deacetylase [Neisseria sp.]
MKKLIINADDLGFSHGVNAAIVELAARGRISSASFMRYGVLETSQRDALTDSGIDIGLHFDLTSPLCPDARPLTAWLASSLLGMVSTTSIRRSAEAQLQGFADVWQRPPAFIDGHQHVHQLPVIRDALSAVWVHHYPAHAPQWRITRPFQGTGSLKAQVIYALGGRGLLRRCRASGWRHNTAFGGAYGFDGDLAALATQWERWLHHAPQHGGLVMCHPAQTTDTAAPDDEIAAARVREWQWLNSEAFETMLARHQVQVTGWQRSLAGD